MDWRLLVEELIDNIGVPLDFLPFHGFYDCWCCYFLLGLWVFANYPPVHSAGVCRGESVAVAVGISDR